ncbi:MAG: peptidylprolyl isomerase [Pseudoflavonifractor sp.]|nr:peptidylprolyl isomerase [Pseudoflavonifractor sp.]
MSASDRKQQRKSDSTAGLTQRELKERAEAQAARQKKTVYMVVGIICAVAAAALLVWNSNFWVKTAVAATVDGTDYKVPDLQYYYVQARNNQYSMYQMYSAYGISTGYDPSKGDGEQWYSEADGKTYADYFRETGLDSLKQVAALCKAAAAEGYTLSEDGQAQIDNTFAQIDKICAQNGLTRSSYFAQVYGNGVTEKVFARNMEKAVLASEYEKYHQNSLSYPDEELQAYYNENPNDLDSYTYRSFQIDGTAANPTDANGDPVKDASGNTVTATDEEKKAAMDTAKTSADAAVAEIESASDRETAFIAAAPNYVAQSAKENYAAPEYSLSEKVQGSTLKQNSSAIANWLMDSARKSGDVTAIETTSGYTVVLFLNRELVQDPTVDIRHILIKAETSDADTTDDSNSKVPSQEEMDAAKAKAQSLLDKWKAGEATEESFGALAKENSEDSGSASKGGEYTYVRQGQMFAAFDQWIFDPARKSGDVELIENTQSGQQGWHIVYFEKTEAPYWKSLAISAKQSADQSEWLKGITDSVEAAAADGMKYVGAANTVTAESAAPAESSTTESETPAASESPAA